MELNPKYNIYQKYHPDLNLKLFCHNMNYEKGIGSQPKRFQDVIRYYCDGDIDENNFCHYAESCSQALAIIKNQGLFTCICSHPKCIKKCLIQHKISKKIFLVGSKCWEELFNRLVAEYKVISKNRNKLLKQHEKDLQKQKQNDEKDLQKQKQDYEIIKNMIVNFGRYQGQTFDDIDDKYVLYIIKDFEKIHKSIKLYYRVVKFFCNKINFDNIKDDIKDDISEKDAIKIIQKLYKINKSSKFYNQLCTFFCKKFNLEIEYE